MSKADKMFEELGYQITEIVEPEENKYLCGIQFKKENNLSEKYIEFYFYHHQVLLYKDNHITNEVTRSKCNILDMSELQAINEKCKELGWL